MNTLRISLLKPLQSVTMRQLHHLKNKLFKVRNPTKKYTRFHAQFGEDRYIFEKLDLPEQGVFVDVGAGHPIHLSNTYFFEKNGWTGLCIDADPTQYKRLCAQRARVEWAAVSPQEGEIELSQAYIPTYSTTFAKEDYKGLIKIPFKDVIKVPSFKLETILKKHNINAIDLLSIDVEGSELEVWNTLDYEKHTPKIVIVEYYTFGLADNSEKIKSFFSHLPYRLVHTTCTNFIFLHQPS